MTQTAKDLLHVKASCHCTSNTFRITFEHARLPIKNALCHCNTCRHSSGRMAAYFVQINGVPYRWGAEGEIEGQVDEDVPASLANLTEYRTSPAASRWFCTTCGAQVLRKYDNTQFLNDAERLVSQDIAQKSGIDLQTHGEGEHGAYWSIAAGLLERVEGIVQVGYHSFVGDTLDGGLADHFRGIPGEELKRWAGLPERSKLLERGWKSQALVASQLDGEKLRFHCQCRGVELYITRPLPRTTPRTEKEWYLPPDASRFFAGHDGCESCRRTAGFEIVSWMVAPPENIYNARTGERIEFEAEVQTGMSIYESSAGRRRYFCSTCGAAVFWHATERPDGVDIAMGLIEQSQDGTRAENWLVWARRLFSAGELLSSHSRRSLEHGLS